MGSIAEILEYMEYGRQTLLKAIDGLSHREMTEVPLSYGWTVKDILAHVAGWDYRSLQILPLIVQDQAANVPGVDVELYNRQSIQAWQDKSLAEILAEIKATHRQILEFIANLDHKEIDRRHDRNGRVITIRSYVLNIMVEHERQHAAEISLWREGLDKDIEPEAVVAALQQCRTEFMQLLAQLDETAVLDRAAVGNWSISDMVGHIADWEQYMLKSARHITDEAQPRVVPLRETTAAWNEVMAAQRQKLSWAQNFQALLEVQEQVDALMATLTPADWVKRGPFPWHTDQGTLAALIAEITEHYEDHLPDLKRWLERTQA